MNHETQAGQIRKLGAAPDFMLGSVQAVTEAGQLVAASGSGSQIGPYASGAGQLILVIGAQKVVPDLDAALRRITEHVQPYEDMRLRELIGEGTQLARILILERDFRPGRTTISQSGYDARASIAASWPGPANRPASQPPLVAVATARQRNATSAATRPAARTASPAALVRDQPGRPPSPATGQQGQASRQRSRPVAGP